ncbi:MAG: hypothetical protein RLZZ227_2656, partial [Pseudomonadota bacterium]
MQSMQLTDWLVVIFIVAILVVLVDGVRRKLIERRSRVIVKLERNIPVDAVSGDELPNSELPNGGARTLDRGERPPPSLRTLQSKRKAAFRAARQASASEDTAVRPVPVLLDTLDVEEHRIEHTNVFADSGAIESFKADDFLSESVDASDESLRASSPASRHAKGSQSPQGSREVEDDNDELIDGLDEEYEEDAMLGEESVARKPPGYMDTRYQGRDDEYEDEDEEEFDDDEEEDDDEDELDDDLESPA